MLGRCWIGRKIALPGIVPTSIQLSIVRSTGWPITVGILWGMRCIEILCLFFIGIPKFGIEFWFLNFSTAEFKKSPESLESRMESVFCFQWGSQKLEPNIGIPNQDSAFLSLPHQGFWLVATHPRWGRRPRTPPKSDDNSSSHTLSNWSMEGLNFLTWLYFENKGSHELLEHRNGGVKQDNLAGGGNSPPNHGCI